MAKTLTQDEINEIAKACTAHLLDESTCELAQKCYQKGRVDMMAECNQSFAAVRRALENIAKGLG